MTATNNADDIIAQLVDDLSPTTTLKTRTLWISAIVALSLTTVVILGPQGLRPNLAAAWDAGTAVWKSALFAVFAIASVFWMNRYSRPSLTSARLAGGFSILALGILMAAFIVQIGHSDAHSVMMYAVDHVKNALGCFASIIVGGVVGFLVLFKGWLQRSASLFPRTLGFVSGLLSGSLAAFAYSFHCPHDNMMYVSLYYGGSVVIVAIVSAVWSGRYLKW